MANKLAKQYRADWTKNALPTTAQVAGQWYSLLTGGGNPAGNSLMGGGTNLAFQALTDSLAGSGSIQHGGTAGGRDQGYKQLVGASAFTAASTTAPCVLTLVDVLGFYPVTTVTATTEQAFDNTVTLPRYATGQGVQAYITPSTVMGAATPDITLKYTNSDGVAGKTTPATLPSGNTAAPVGSIVYSGTGAGKFGPFVPLAAGDKGIRSIQSITLSASYVSGVLNVVLARPIATIPIGTSGIVSTVNFVNEVLNMPKVYDGACLSFLMYAGANTPVNSALFGHLDFAWE